MWGRLRGGAATPALVYYSGINWTAIAAIATLWEVYYQVRCVRQGSLPMHVCDAFLPAQLRKKNSCTPLLRLVPCVSAYPKWHSAAKFAPPPPPSQWSWPSTLPSFHTPLTGGQAHLRPLALAQGARARRELRGRLHECLRLYGARSLLRLGALPRERRAPRLPGRAGHGAGIGTGCQTCRLPLRRLGVL